MNNFRVVYETDDKQYRIIEHADEFAELSNLKGDIFNPEVNPDIDPERLKEEERHFEELVAREGVYGYVLERWNAEPGTGYEHVDSCWGFVGQYTPTEGIFNHYIVDELKAQIPIEVGPQRAGVGIPQVRR